MDRTGGNVPSDKDGMGLLRWVTVGGVAAGAVAVVVLWAVLLLDKPQSTPRQTGFEARGSGQVFGTMTAAPDALFIGGSLAMETPPAGPNSAYPQTAARLLGWRMIVDGQDNTGFVTPEIEDAGREPIGQRIANASLLDPRVVILSLGYDDARARVVPELERQVAQDALRAIAEQLGKPKVIVVGPIAPTGRPDPATLELRDALLDATATSGATFIDPIQQQWVPPTLAKSLIAADGVHLTPSGHARIGLLLADELSQLSLIRR